MGTGHLAVEQCIRSGEDGAVGIHQGQHIAAQGFGNLCGAEGAGFVIGFIFQEELDLLYTVVRDELLPRAR